MFLFCLDDHSRVRLQRHNVDYINASLVEVPDANRAYILTQVCGFYCMCLVDNVACRQCWLMHEVCVWPGFFPENWPLYC